MKKKINQSILFLALVSMLLVTVIFAFFTYRLVMEQTKEQLGSTIALFSGTESKALLENEVAINGLENNDNNLRVSIISPSGVVVFDNKAAVNTLENHLAREEVQLALSGKTGIVKRYSETVNHESFYAATRLEDGSVLRLGKTINSALGVFMQFLPLLGLILLLLIIVIRGISQKMTQKIIAPFKTLDLHHLQNEAIYEELEPFLYLIAKQKKVIDQQVGDLKQRLTTIQALIEHMGEGLVLLDSAGIILAINGSAQSFFAVDTGVIGAPFIVMCRDLEINAAVDASLSGEDRSFENKKEQGVFQLFFNHVATGGALLFIFDRTATALAEQRRQEFTANVSHELKTPLTTVYGYAELLEHGLVVDEEVPAVSGKIKEESQRLLQLIEQILYLATLDEAPVDKRKTSVSLEQLLNKIIGTLQLKAAKHGIKLISEQLRGNVFANETELYELFFNLIDNAINYNVADGHVKIKSRVSANEIVIQIIDTGIGMSKSETERIFERFYRIETSRSKATGGSGLGLAIVKHLVLKNNGTISVESTVGVGTMFTVTFPNVSK